VEFVAILRVLWRRRVVVAVGVVAAIGVGVLVARGQTTHAGAASTRVVLDTPDSQLVNRAPKGADSLEWRAAMLANLIAREPVRRQIARDLRIAAGQLSVIEPALTTPTVPTPLASHALAAAETTGDYVLTVQYEPGLPIISMETRAPDAVRATRLVEAATRALTTAAKTPRDPRELQGFVVDSFGRPQSWETVSAPDRWLALGVSVVVFALWCAGLALLAGMARAWRAAGRVQAA
jgi:hypothetical protein